MPLTDTRRRRATLRDVAASAPVYAREDVGTMAVPLTAPRAPTYTPIGLAHVQLLLHPVPAPGDSERLAAILHSRYCRPRPTELERIAGHLGVSRRRVVQLIARGLELLRRPDNLVLVETQVPHDTWLYHAVVYGTHYDPPKIASPT